MRYYVPVGALGTLFRIGMVVTGMMGSLVYWRASRRRAAAQAVAFTSPLPLRAAVIRRSGQVLALERQDRASANQPAEMRP
jgi:uncharacterized protein GlcG (DUF336 family)